jgi:hypothetical protein
MTNGFAAYQQQWPQPTERELQLQRLAVQYHNMLETFDWSVLGVKPNEPYRTAYQTRVGGCYARTVRQKLFPAGLYTSEEIREAIAKEGNRR